MCALLLFLLLADANAGASSAPHGDVFLRLGAIMGGIFFLLVALAGYLSVRGTWVRVIGLALPVVWIAALFFAFDRVRILFEWLL